MEAETLTTYSELADVLVSLPLLVREARRAWRLTLREAGEQVGCSASTLSRFENGDELSLPNAIAVLRWLDIPARPVTEGDERP